MTPSAPPAHLTEQSATDRQMSYIKTLVDQKDLGEHREWTEQRISQPMTKAFASKLIGRLIALDPRPREDVKTRDIVADNNPFKHSMLWEFPAGRYALTTTARGVTMNDMSFYHVTIGKEGTRWHGCFFVKRMASDTEYPVKDHKQRNAILQAIADNPLEAAQRYGKHFGHCAICGRGLTNRLSREIGVGPVCAERVGMTAEAIATIKQSIIDAGHDPEENLS